MFEGNTDPVPYIAASYGIGAVLIFGYAAYLLVQKKRFNYLLKVLRDEERKT